MPASAAATSTTSTASAPAPHDAEAVIHLANKHDWSNTAVSNAAERTAIQAIGDALAGTGRPFLIACRRRRPGSGPAGHRGRPVAVPRPGLAPRRQREPRPRVRRPRRAHREPALRADRARRARPRVHRARRRDRPGEGRLRLPGRRHEPLGGRAPVRRGPHGRARPGEGTGGLPGCTPSPRRAWRPARSPKRSARAFDLPVASIDPDDVQGHFGWIGGFFGMDLSATSAATRELLGWTPTGPTLIEDLDAGAYSPR